MRGREREGEKEVHCEAKPAPPSVVISAREGLAAGSSCAELVGEVGRARRTEVAGDGGARVGG